jgi:iron complex outermembrane receptor protein
MKKSSVKFPSPPTPVHAHGGPTTRKRSALFVVILAATAVNGLRAQPSSSAAKNDEVINLSPFAVTSQADRGYVASESMSGSRVATAIKDLPFQMSVVTSEFMKDFGAFEMTTESFAYTSGVTALDLSGTGNSKIRGYSSQYGLRDGFFRLGRTDPVIIDRVEFIKGPNVASIYGETQPGGIINMITKRPTTRARANVSLMTGSYGNDREEFTVSGPLTKSKKTLFLVVASDYERTYQIEGASLRNRSAAIGVEHKTDSGGDLYVLASTWRGQGHTAMSNAPYYFDSASKTYKDLALNLIDINQNGPASDVTREASDVTVTFDQPINSVFSFRMGANWWHSKKWNFDQVSGTQYDYAINRLTRGLPTKGLIDEDGGGIQADLLAHEKFAAGAIDTKTLVTFDISDYYRFQPTWTLNANTIISNTATTPAPGAPGTYWFRYIFPGQTAPDYSIPTYSAQAYTKSVSMKNRASIFGGLIREQVSLLGNQLMAFGTLRYDRVIVNLHNYIGAGNVAHGTNSAVSPSLGLNYKATPWLSA